MKRKLWSIVILFLLFVPAFTKVLAQGQVNIIDARHYSNVFGESRNYRIFLPPGYSSTSDKKYPVIYFLHGWAQRYFGSGADKYSEFDKGNDKNGDNIEKFVTTHEVIVVKSDGYNRSPHEDYYLRPYNIGPVETYRQFPIYFPELVNFIDATYNTLTDRGHRAITGLSMGGFMSFVIGGKYPHLFSFAGSFCGSPEFFIGPKDFPVEYRHMDMYKNYGGMNVRLHYGSEDFIRGYHEDLNRVWTQVMDNYGYKIYPGDQHTTSGLGEMFEFAFTTFRNPLKKPSKWSHIDVYPEFSVWDYSVSSDRNVPGFTILENVNERGFRSSVREFLPNGEVLAFVTLAVTTPPIYEKNQPYHINIIDVKTQKASLTIIRSDNLGRLKVVLNGGVQEIGINKPKDKPNISFVSYTLQSKHWATHNKDISMSIELLNKGNSGSKNVQARLSTLNKNTTISQAVSPVESIGVNETQSNKTPFVFKVTGDSLEVLKFKLTMTDESKNEWIEFFEVELKKDHPEIKNVEIADGRKFAVTKGGNDFETTVIGFGNGDGVANPGESIELLVRDGNKYYRTSLYSTDKWVNPFGIQVRRSDYWGQYDHVGGSAKYSIPMLASDCPQNQRLEFLAEYWLPDNPRHTIKQGRIFIEVTGKDTTPPKLTWMNNTGDNVMRVKIYDGAAIKLAKATFTGPGMESFELDLNDVGKEGDNVGGDTVFSIRISEKEFGFYRVIVEVTDTFGNKAVEESPAKILLH
jgi:S-formylglutathione hydrolase FrmB